MATAGGAAQASHSGSYAYKKEMRRSMYQRTFFRGSTLYRHDMQRRPSTLPPHVQQYTTALSYVAPHTSARVTLAVPTYNRLGVNLRYPSFIPGSEINTDARRSFSVADNRCPQKMFVDSPSGAFSQSQDSEESTASYMSPRSYHSFSNPVEELEMDVFSRQSSEISDEVAHKRNGSLLKFYKKGSTDTTDETWKTAGSVEAVKSEWSDSVAYPHSDEESLDGNTSLGRSVIDVRKEPNKFLLKLQDDINKEVAKAMPCNKAEQEFFRQALLVNRCYYDEYDSEHLAKNKEDIVFKFDVSLDKPDSLKPQSDKLSARHHREKSAEDEKDEGYADLTAHSYDVDELCDMFGSSQKLGHSATFRKERSLDSDETSGFISKHSSETTDLSLRLANVQFTTKQLSEPMGFGSANMQSELTRQQHLSEPTDMPQHQTQPINQSYSDGLLIVDTDSTEAGSTCKKREIFRKSRRLKHFNLRRIDDTDNDVACVENDRPFPEDDPAGSRLKKEVGLPKHLSRDVSIDRYGLFKSRSEKTITSFESDRGQSRLQDFESFCEAVNFKGSLTGQQKAASADELEPYDMDGVSLPRTPPSHHSRRRSRSSRSLTRRLKCLLL